MIEIKKNEKNEKYPGFLFPSSPIVDKSLLQLSEEGKYSITPWQEANNISQIIHNFYNSEDEHSFDKNTCPKIKPKYSPKPIITDATASCGGNTISFNLNNFEKVNSVEIDKDEYNILINNLNAYKITTENTHNTDYLKIIKDLKQDIVYMDPPWGGHDYAKHTNLDLFLSGVNIIDICTQIIVTEKLASLIVIKVPVNYNLQNMCQKISCNQNTGYCIYKVFRKAGHHSYNIIMWWNTHNAKQF